MGKRRGKVRNYWGDPRKKPNAPFFPIKQHPDGGVEDQYGLVHYPDIDDDCPVKHKTSLLRTPRGQFVTELSRPGSSMSVSSSGKTSAPTPSAISNKTSKGGSVSDGDIMK